MASVPSNRRGRKPAGDGTPAPAPPTLVTPIKLSRLRERQQALQECGANRMLWKIITAARELRDEILFFVEHVESHNTITLAAHALEDAGISTNPDKLNGRDFGPNTFHTAIDDFKAIALAIKEHVGCVAGDIPPAPVTKREVA